jgi:hypothetical protein
MKQIIIFFLIFIFLYLIFNNNEKMKDGDNFNFKYLNSKFSTFVKNKVYSNNSKIEITKLPFCNNKITVDYGINTNNVINNNISIYQNIIDPLEHTIVINSKNFNLVCIRWVKSKLSFNNKQIGLELQFIHQSYGDNINKFIISIPLDFVSNGISPSLQNINHENFKNVGYIKMPNIFKDDDMDNNYDNASGSKQYVANEKNEKINKYNLNVDYNDNIYNKKIYFDSLLQSDGMIPEYKCCRETIGENITFNFCDGQNFLSKVNKFYQLQDHYNNMYYITNTVPYPEQIGLNILNKITDDNLTVYIK